MTQSAPSPLPAPYAGMVDLYEQLRRQVLSLKCGGSADHGLALFLRQGMKRWMDAWPRCPIAESPKAPIPCRPVEAVVPWDLRAEVVAILTGMALSIRQEMRV
jgi:hypothetical protein